MKKNRWLELIESNPEHSANYIQRFRDMDAEGRDLHGEARLIDAMAARGSRILDAGCGPGRVGGELHRLGHQVVGLDLDPVLIAAAKRDHPDSTWLVADLAELVVDRSLIGEGFDLIVSAGNVITFVEPEKRVAVLRGLGEHLAPDGRVVMGFGAGRDYEFPDFRTDLAEAGLAVDVELSTWDLQPLTDESEFLVAILRRQSS